MRVGILALQGDVPEQEAVARRILGTEGKVLRVRGVEDLERVDGLFLPGGESSAIADLIQSAQLWEPLSRRLEQGMPVLATCAGLILLARRLDASRSAGTNPRTFGALDVTVRRNDYGRQAESFEAMVEVEGLSRPFPGVFIRAPRILEVGPGAEPLARRGEEVVGVRTGPVWGLAFHPELADDLRLHEAWLEAARHAIGSPRGGRARGEHRSSDDAMAASAP